MILTYGNHDHNIRDKGKFVHYFNNVIPAADTQYIQFKGVKIVVNHYPLAIWHQGHKGALHAFGHVHGSYLGLGKSLDVGIDNAYAMGMGFAPISFDTFVKLADDKDAHLESHHNSRTN